MRAEKHSARASYICIDRSNGWLDLELESSVSVKPSLVIRTPLHLCHHRSVFMEVGNDRISSDYKEFDVSISIDQLAVFS